MSARKPAVLQNGVLPVTENRRAHMRYSFDEKLEVGIVLTGSEVKSVRDGKFELGDAWAQVIGGKLLLMGAYIAPWAFATAYGHEPRRVRTLLAHKEEIEKLDAKIRQRGYTLIALRAYLKGGKVKLELGLGKGKEQQDRREELKAREQEREARAAMVRARS